MTLRAFSIRRAVPALLALAVPCALAAQEDAADVVWESPVATTSVTLTGLLDGSRDRVDMAGVTLAVNGTAAMVDRDGRYTVTLAPAPYYQLAIGGPQVFAMVQTFGQGEALDPACACLNLPAIELVERRRNRIELFFAGDSMAGRRFSEPLERNPQQLDAGTLELDLDRLLAPMRPYIETADLATLNLESVLADARPGDSPNKRFTFYSPTALAAALRRAGIDHVSLGNNHTYDYMDAGLHSTLAALDGAGVRHSGAGMNLDQALQAARVGAGRERLALLGFVGWEGRFTPNQVAGETKGGAAHGTAANLNTAITRERHAGYIPIMQYHGSAEYSDRPSDFSVRRMRQAIDGGAPVVSSHHPHLTQGLELYNDGLIAFSLGNFLFDQERSETQATFAMKVWLEDGRFLRAEVIPLQVLDYRPVPAVGTLREAVLRRTFALSAERGTFLQMSGGHAVVRPERAFRTAPASAGQPCAAEAGLRRTAMIRGGDAFCQPGPGARAGQDLLMRGDFENAEYSDARDRFWVGHGAQVDFRRSATDGGYLHLTPENRQSQPRLYSGPYQRRLVPGRYTLRARVRLARPARLELALKTNPLEGDAPTAPWRGDAVGGVQLAGTGAWQAITLDFTVHGDPAAPAPPMRPIIALQFPGASGAVAVDFDDMEIIRWPDTADQLAGGSLSFTHLQPGALAAAAPDQGTGSPE